MLIYKFIQSREEVGLAIKEQKSNKVHEVNRIPSVLPQCGEEIVEIGIGETHLENGKYSKIGNIL